MGTDQLGRDVFSRIIYGGRVSMAVGFISSILALTFGTLCGGISGYIGGRTDNYLMRIVDVIYSLPDLLLIILINIVIGRGVAGIIIAISLVSWVNVARLVRGEVLRIKEEPFIEAAQALGSGKDFIIPRPTASAATLSPLAITRFVSAGIPFYQGGSIPYYFNRVFSTCNTYKGLLVLSEGVFIDSWFLSPFWSYKETCHDRPLS